MRLIARSLLCMAAASLVLALLSPWLLYEWGLQQVHALPAKPAGAPSGEQQARVWKHAGSSTPQPVESLNPYSFVWNLFGRQDVPAAERLAAWVARDHLIEQNQALPQLKRHIAETALMIWLTRHWATDELVAAARPIVDRDLAYRARRAAERRAAEDQPPDRSRAASAR